MTEMEQAQQLLRQLRAQGIRLQVSEDRLQAQGETGAMTPAMAEGIRQHKALLLSLLAGNTDSRLAIKLDPANRFQPFALNENQQAYWLGRSAHLEGGNVAIHLYFELDASELDIDRLELCWQQLVNRHAMLRAVVTPDGQQQILQQVPAVSIGRVNAGDHFDTTLKSIRESLSHQNFDLQHWPQFEFSCVQGAGKRTLCLSIDCWAIDGWSYQILFVEWAQLYAGRDILPTFELSFRDYCLASQQQKKSATVRSQLLWWQAQAATLPDAPVLPRASRSADHGRFERRQHWLSQTAVNGLRSWCADQGVTVAATLLSAYAAVLQRWSGEQQFTLNIPRFNRQPLHPDVNRIVGEFASFTLLGINWHSKLPFSRQVAKVQHDMLQAISRDRISGVQVLRMRNELRGETGTMPFVFTNAPEQHSENGEKQSFLDALEQLGSLQYAISQTPQVWIDCQYHESRRGLYLFWDVRQGIFPAGMTDQMFDVYISLLSTLAKGKLDDHNPVQLASIASHADQYNLPDNSFTDKQLTNAPPASKPVDNLIWQRFQLCATRQPQTPAVISSALSFSWQQLQQYSQTLAAELSWVTEPGQRILLLLEKGPWQSVAVLAAIHQGLTVVPLDASAPLARQQFIAQDTEAEAVISNQAQEKTAQALGLKTLDVDTLPTSTEAAEPSVIPAIQSAPDILLTIYTSGSTGQPKGVDVPRDGLLNAVDYTLTRFAIDEQDRLFALTQMHHDMAWFDLLALYSAGTTLIYPDSTYYRDPTHWQALLEQHQPTVWNSVPQLMEMLLSQLSNTNTRLSSLRLAFLGGDWLALSLPQRMQAQLPGCQLVSVGGPTETTLWNIMYPVRDVADDWQSIPYGYPIANNRYRILDAQGRDCPIGVTGELCCTGIGVSPGYLNREELNAEKFTRDDTGQRMFRTGDQGRYRHDGSIEFMGRNDRQIMVGGYRIEPQEVIRHLCTIDGIDTAELALLDGQLVAWLVAPQNHLPALPVLQTQLSQWLPQQMMPQRFYQLEALPLTSNGKVDRAILETLLDQPLQATDNDASPLTGPHQQQVADCWQQILGQRPNRADDDFFQHGGHSLAAVKLYGLLWPRGNTQYSVVSLFEHRTVAAQADLLTQSKLTQNIRLTQGDQAQRNSPLQPLNLQKAPLTRIQLGILFSEQLTPGMSVYNLPFRIRMDAKVNLQQAADALVQAFGRHQLFGAVVGEDNQWHASSHASQIDIQINPEVQSETTVLDWALQQAATRFNLTQGPLWCARLLSHEAGHKELLLTIHHLIFDGWSLALLLDDWQACYQGQPLPTPALQFFDYSHWLQQQPEQPADADYWQQQLADYQPLALPTDFERPAHQSFEVDTCIRTLDNPTLKQLQQLATHYQTTPFVVLTSSWLLLLSRYADQDDLVIGTYIAQRDQPLLQKLPGMLLNNLVLRARLQPQMRFSGLLEQQRDSSQQAFAHAGLPFEQLVRLLGEQRDSSRHPIYQTTVVVDNSAINDLQADNPMALELLPACQRYGHMDLELNVQQLGKQMRASFVYATDLFQRQTIEQLADQFTHLLDQILTAPEQPLSALSFNTPSQQQQLATLGQGAHITLPPQRIADYWQQTVTRQGDAIAVIEGAQQISFKALDNSAARLTAQLLDSGVIAGDVVAVHLAPGVELVRALLALIKLGCCYMPLQPDLPLARKQTMLRQTECQHLIGEALPSIQGLNCHSAQVDSHPHTDSAQATLPVSNQPAQSAAETALYIVFTSGSTGEPKVIRATEQATLNRLHWGWQQMPLAADDCSALKTAPGFVDAIHETLEPLLQGCPLVTISYLDQLQPEQMLTQLASHGVTRLLMVPSLMESLLHWCEQAPERYAPLLQLRWLTLSGESLSPALARLLRKRLPHTHITNLYGSAEVGADVLSYRLPSPDSRNNQSKRTPAIPLGLPLYNCVVEVHDSWGGLTPLGGKGELIISGPQVVAGYPGQPDHPQFSQHKGAIRFHSQDLARLDTDGQFHFLGRADHTVKIRGQRLALGDINQTLLNCRGVVAASTQLLEGPQLGTQLVLQPGTTLAEVQQTLHQQLPGWMVPSRWLQSEQLPMLPNGKINPHQVQQLLQHSANTEAPLADRQQWSSTEQQLASLWQQLTKQPVQHRQQSFFDAGGHSLLLTRLLHSLNRQFQLSLDIASLYNGLELARMASLVDALSATTPVSHSIEEEGVL